MLKELGFIRVGAIVPKIKVANTQWNSEEIIKQLKVADEKGISVVTTPELAVTGYSCADLFHQDILLQKSLEAVKKILEETKDLNLVSIIGIPIEKGNHLFDCAVVIQKGKILGVVPKTFIPNHNEYYEKRWFASGENSMTNSVVNNLTNSGTIDGEDKIILFGQEVPFGNKIIFVEKENNNFTFAVEIGEDLWHGFAPSVNHSTQGAMIIFNLAATSESVGKYAYRKDLVKIQSAKNICGYVYASANVNESTTDAVFSGHAMIAENGHILKENQRFDFESNIIYADIDVLRLKNNRKKNTNFMSVYGKEFYQRVELETLTDLKLESQIIEKNVEKENKFKVIEKIERDYKEYPFVPSNEILRDERCQEIINIQACGLAKRLLHTGIKKTILGLSGGMDSTLAFLVIIEAYKKLGITNENMIAITMPGFGTTNRTYENACCLAKAYGVTLKEISIKEACFVHMKDIGLEETDRSITYENAQARERTQILMDVANKEGGLVIGTGDLSELALGWCTYNGDHMSMYAVNADIPKTLVRYLIKWVADKTKEPTLYDILDTPISPELLPPDEYGNLVQKTENTIGPYVLHDFFLYHFLRYGATPKKIYTIAKQVFKNKFSNEEIKKWLKVFLKRFFTQQFKRSCIPDGPKVGSISISPRSDLKMPSDADASIWLKELEECE